MEIIKKASFTVVGIKETIKEHELFVKVPKVYERLKQFSGQINHKKNNLIIEICLKKEDNTYTELIGYEVTELNPIDKNLVGMKIPEASYLYFLHKGKKEDIFQAYVDMYDYVIREKLVIDTKEFKMEIHDEHNLEYHLYLKLAL